MRQGNLQASGRRKGDFSAWETRRQSGKGFYSTEFVETYNNLSKRDLELKNDYGIDLVSKYTKIPKKAITLIEKKNKQTIFGRNEVYYVKRGIDIVGKLGISYKTDTKDKTTMTFIYQSKGLTTSTKKEKYYGAMDKYHRDKKNRTGKKATF